MPEIFYGTWLIDVIAKDAAFSQRYVINGSDRVDGDYPADTTTPQLQVSGAEWTLTMEWNDNAGSGWQSSRVRRSTVNFTVEDGLVVVLGVDDNWIQFADEDFNDVQVRCQNIDPHLNPWHPHKRTVDFSVQKGIRNDKQQQQPKPGPFEKKDGPFEKINGDVK